MENAVKVNGVTGKVLRCACAAALAGMAVPAVSPVGTASAYADDGAGLSYEESAQKVGPDARQTGYKVYLKQLMVDEDGLGSVRTIDSLYKSADYQEKVIAQYATSADVYEAGGRYYADLGAVSDKGAGHILDWGAIASDDAFDPQDVGDKVALDADTGVAELDASLFEDGAVPVVQTLVACDPDANDTGGIDVAIDNDGTRCTAVAKAQTVDADTSDVTTTVPVATPETAGGITLGDLEVHVNGSEEAYNLVEGESAVWDSATGELTVSESPATVKSIAVKVKSAGAVERLLGGNKAYAAATKKAGDLGCLRGADGKKMTLGSIDRSTFDTGQLYLYDSYYAYAEKDTGSITSKSIFNSIEQTEKYCYLPVSGKDGTTVSSGYNKTSWPSYTDAAGSVDTIPGGGMFLANFAFTPPKTASTKSGKKQSFSGFSKTSTVSTSYSKNHLLAAGCAHPGTAANPNKSSSKTVSKSKDGGKSWEICKGTMAMRVLKFDKSDNYAILSFTTPTTYTQVGCAVYKVKVAAAEPEDAAIAIEKVSSDPGQTDGNAAYSLKGAVFGVFKTKKQAQDAVEAASKNSMNGDDSAASDPDDYDESADPDDADVEGAAGGDGASAGGDAADAAFDAKEYAEQNALATMVTDKDGKATADSLPKYTDKSKKTLATYYIAELEAPQGFKLSTEVATASVKASTTTKSPLAVKFSDEPSVVSIGVYKSVSNPELTDGNPNYSLEGTTFGVYTSESEARADSDGTKAVKTISVKASGAKYYGEVGGLTLGKYYVKETKAAGGFTAGANANVYEVDAETPGVHTVKGDMADGSVGNPADGDPLLIQKVDADTSGTDPQGGATLGRGQFRIKHYALSTEEEQTADSLKGKTPDAEWLVQLDEKGHFEFKNAESPISLSDGTTAPKLLESSYKGVKDATAKISNAYKNAAGTPVIPFGWVTVSEEKAPAGYKASDEVKVIRMDASDDATFSVSYADSVLRGDVKLKKVDDAGTPLANVPFRITNRATGEKHVIVTDANGEFDSAKATNTNSAAGDNDGFSFAAEAAAALAGGGTTTNSSDGCWFGDTTGTAKAPESEKAGAFQYGEYTIEELSSPANWGKKLIEPTTFKVEGTETQLAYDLGEIVDKTIRIKTTATDAASGGKDVTIGHDSVISDEVELSNLNDDTDYELTGTLMDKATGTAVKDSSGADITASVEVKTGKDTPETTTKTVELPLDTSLIDADADLVVFERLTDKGRPEYTEPVAVHEDLDDEGQTVRLNGIKTTATDKTDGDKVLLNSKTAKITDSVEYKGLKEGTTYKLVATLVDQDGNDVKGGGEASFKGKAEGVADVTVTLDAGKMAKGDEVTVYEKLYEEGDAAPVATHKQAGDKGQTVRFTDVPEVTTPPTGEATPPKTGADTTWLAAAAALMALLGAGCGGAALRGRRKKHAPAKGWND